MSQTPLDENVMAEHIRQENGMCMNPLGAVEVMRDTVAGGIGKAWTSRAVFDPLGISAFS